MPKTEQRARLTDLLAQLHDGVEDWQREVDPGVDRLQVGQLHTRHFVHRRELERRLGRHARLVQRRARRQQPTPSPRPPQRVIRPVTCHVWKTVAVGASY